MKPVEIFKTGVKTMTVELLQDVGNVYDVPLNTLISLEKAGFEDGGWCYRGIDEEHVDHLAESEMSEWPPLEIVKVRLATGNVLNAVIDGNHRWQAAARKKAPTIRARAGSYASEDEVIEAAFRANLKNGRNASTENRSEYALWLYFKDPSEKPNMSAIARKVGLNVSSVSRKINAELRRLDAEREAEERGTSLLEITETQRLLAAIHRYLENETAFLSGQHTERSVKKRASSLLTHLNSMTDKNKQRSAVQDLQTFALTLAQIQWNDQGQKKRNA